MKKRIYNVNLEKITEDELIKLREQYMKNPMSLLDVDEEDADFLTEKFTSFLRDYKENNDLKGYVVGLSGGIDSSLVACLAVEAVGKENVLGLLIPSQKTSQESIDLGKKIAENYDIAYAIVDKCLFELAILADNLIEESIEKQLGEQGRWSHEPNDRKDMRIGNDHARQRMKIIRREAAKYGLLVGGTTNQTEQQLCYFTTAGDGRGGVDLEPILELPKTSEFQYARHKNLPREIVDRIPTAELVDNQTDEGELCQQIGSKVNYRIMDLIITGQRLGLNAEEIVKANNDKLITTECIKNLYAFMEKVSYKRKPEPHTDLAYEHK